MKRAGLQNVLYMLPELARALLTRPITIRYPFAPLDLPDYFRGRVVIDAERCRGCGLCVRDCPAGGLELIHPAEGGFRLVHYPDRCANCGQCETSCRSGAIRQTNAFVPGCGNLEEMIEVTVNRSEEDCTQQSRAETNPKSPIQNPKS